MQSQGDYYQNIVAETVKRFPDHSIVEIGTDGGTTAIRALDAMKKFTGWFFTIDPYGDKPYKAGDDTMNSMGYTDKRYMEIIPQLYQYAQKKGVKYLHWKITSLDWMKIWEGIDFWHDDNGHGKLEFSLAYLDGDHSWHPVEEEFNYFYDRIPEGGYIIIDDFNLLGGEETVRRQLPHKGTWHFNYEDDHHRCYLQK